ncbi:MAG: hypothetical protein ACI4JZ_00365 [Oscillospiraceae bacterium]
MICITCGREIIDEAAICQYCGCLTGVQQRENVNQYIDKSGSPNTYVPQNNSFVNRIPYNEPDSVNPWLVIVSLILPIIGLIIGINNQKDGKKKSGKVYIILSTIILAILFILTIIGLVYTFYVFYQFEIHIRR